MGGQAFYLINATDGNLQRSGMAFWADEDNVSKNIAPDSYIEIEDNGFVAWEGTLHMGKFPNNDIFQTCIVTNGQGIGLGNLAGFARNNNRAWNIYRNDDRVAWSLNGWNYHAIYSCE